MSTEARATVQYGDMRGTISIDGWDGLSAISLGGAEKDYWPVGLELYGEPDTKGGDLDPLIYLLAVDCAILDGSGGDAVAKYAKEHGEIPVFRFATQLTLAEILPRIKRLSIVLQDKSTKGVPLMRAEIETQE